MTHNNTLTYTLYTSGLALSVLVTSVQADSQRLQWSSNQHFYQRFDQPATWQAAKTKCESKGGHLATITTEAEKNFVNNNIYKDRAFWLGASDSTKEGSFAWVTGEKWSYNNLSSSLHNNQKNDYLWSSTFEWGVNTSVDMNIYVCEWSTHSYIGVASVPDINGNRVNEIATLYVDYITKKHTVEIRDPKTDKTISTVTFKTDSRPPQGFVIINDINGNGVPEVGVMYSKIANSYSNFGQPSVEIKDAKNNKTYLKTLYFLNPSFSPKEISVSPDTNGNGSNEIIVLGMGKATNIPQAEMRDSKTGAVLSGTQF